MSDLSRRNLLTSSNNPHSGLDYLVSLDHGLRSNIQLTLRYIPGQQVLNVESLNSYLTLMEAMKFASLEALGALLVDDLNSALSPRWLHISLNQTLPLGHHHTVVLEQRKPGWDNPHLLQRLKPV